MTRALVASHRGRPLPVTCPYDLPEVPLSDETVNALTGTWIGPMGVMDVSGRRGRLVARLGSIPITAIHRGDGLLSLDVRVLGIPVVRVSYATLILHEVDGEHYLETIYHGLSIGSATRYDPPPVSPAWRNRAGEYEVLNPGGGALATGVELQYDRRRDRLTAVILDHSGRPFMILPLEIIDETIAITGGFGRTSDEVLEIRMIDGEEHLFVSGMELRQVE